MFTIHEIRTKQNFKAFYTVCERENVDFFSMINLVKLLKDTLNYGEILEDKKISYNRFKINHKRFDGRESLNKYIKELLCRKIKEPSSLIEMEDEAFSVKLETLKMFEEICKIQRAEDRNSMIYGIKCGRAISSVIGDRVYLLESLHQDSIKHYSRLPKK